MATKKTQTKKSALAHPLGAGPKVLLLRTSDKDRRSHGGFQYPTSGLVSAPDWSPRAECGRGLHGLLWGSGGGGLVPHDEGRVWQVLEALAAEVVELSGKVKVPRALVVYSGAQEGALKLLQERAPRDAAICFVSVSAGDYGQATAGDYGQATAGNYGQAMAGNNGQATAGDNGQAMAGNNGQATAGYNGKATAGYNGKATAGDNGQATAGDNGLALSGGRAKAGKDGQLVLRYLSADRLRYLVACANVGIDGFEAGVWYEVRDGKIARAENQS